MTPRIIRCFDNVDMRNGHDGLKVVALEKKVDLEKLAMGELVIFLNNAQTKLKMYAANEVFAYYRSPRGKIQAEMVAEIPKSFGGGGVNFNAAAKAALTKLLEKKNA